MEAALGQEQLFALSPDNIYANHEEQVWFLYLLHKALPSALETFTLSMTACPLFFQPTWPLRAGHWKRKAIPGSESPSFACSPRWSKRAQVSPRKCLAQAGWRHTFALPARDRKAREVFPQEWLSLGLCSLSPARQSLLGRGAVGKPTPVVSCLRGGPCPMLTTHAASGRK